MFFLSACSSSTDTVQQQDAGQQPDTGQESCSSSQTQGNSSQTQSCGLCNEGTQSRHNCNNEWSDWSECSMDPDVCVPGSTQACNRFPGQTTDTLGISTCISSCVWLNCSCFDGDTRMILPSVSQQTTSNFEIAVGQDSLCKCPPYNFAYKTITPVYAPLSNGVIPQPPSLAPPGSNCIHYNNIEAIIDGFDMITIPGTGSACSGSSCSAITSDPYCCQDDMCSPYLDAVYSVNSSGDRLSYDPTFGIDVGTPLSLYNSAMWVCRINQAGIITQNGLPSNCVEQESSFQYNINTGGQVVYLCSSNCSIAGSVPDGDGIGINCSTCVANPYPALSGPYSITGSLNGTFWDCPTDITGSMIATNLPTGCIETGSVSGGSTLYGTEEYLCNSTCTAEITGSGSDATTQITCP